MKRVLMTAILLTGAAWTAEAQSDKAVPVGGPPPSTIYVWVVCNQGNTVALRDSGGNAVATLQGGAFGFNAPYDIAGSPLHHRVFITNNGAPNVTVIDSDTLQVLGLVPVPGANLRGIALSEDQSTVFIAGEDPNPVTGGPAVFQIDTVSLAPGTKTASVVAPGFGAEDCDVIRRANTGGSGNAPGKVYFSVRTTTSTPQGFIGVIDLVPTVSVTTIPAGVGALSTVGTPDRMERTTDNRFVCVGCTRIVGSEGAGPFTIRTIMIDVSNDSATSPLFLTSTLDAAHQVVDVTWRADPGGANRGFILAQVSGVLSIYEIFDTGAFKAGPVSTTGVTQGITLRFAPLLEQVFLGDINGTGQGYQAYDAKSALVVANTPNGVGVRCQAFAVMSTPRSVITDICPRGALAAGSNIVTVHGSGFTSLSTYGGLAAIPVGFIDSNTVTVDLGGAPAATLGLTINNPNLQNGTIDLFFRRYTPEALGSFPITFPPAAQGYRMSSVPQYISLTALKAALAAQFGAYNPVLYRVFFYRNGKYVELNAIKDDGCDLAGEAFWIITRNGGTVTFGAPDVFNNAGGSTRVIPINPGFNLISLPMTNAGGASGAINWANILVTDDPTNFATAQGTGTPFGLGILAPAALEFVKGSYVTADPLLAGRGYWVQNIGSKPAYLLYSTAVVFKAITLTSAGAPAPPGMSPPPPPSDLGEGGSSCGCSGIEALLVLLAVRGFHRSRRLRRLVA